MCGCLVRVILLAAATAVAAHARAQSVSPVPDMGTAVSGIASTPIANVAANDTVNGAPAILGTTGNATVAELGGWPAGISLDPNAGAVSITAAVAPGTYTLQYQLCDLNSPPDCASTTDTVTVSASLIAVPETGTAVAGTASTPIANVTANDTVNGAPAILGATGNATVAELGDWPAGISLDPNAGAISTTAAVSPGTYSLQYQLCDLNSPPDCASTTDTVTITASIIIVVANPDIGTAVAGTASTPIPNVAANDTVNGAPATLGATGNATVAQLGSWPAGISLDPDAGAVSTTAAVPPGTYSLQYQLCDLNSPPDCASTTDTVTVSASLIAVPDTGTAVAGTASIPIANVAANDSVNGAPAVLGTMGNATVAQLGSWPAGISLDPNAGAVSTTASVPAGTYSLQYQLCDLNSPPDCASTTDTVTITSPTVTVVANPEVGTAVAGTASTPIANVAANDTVNGAPAILGATGNATVAELGNWPAGISLDPNAGAVSTTAAVPAGTYSLGYQLCDLNSPPDCASTTDTVTITSPIVIVIANPDTGTALAGTASTPIPNVAANDTVNGAPATLGAAGNATVAQVGTWPAGIALNASTGAITTTAAVAPGTYNLQYQLCDLNSPPDCASAADTITVAASVVANPETGSADAGVTSIAIANVAANDSVNGAPATLGPSGNATVTKVGAWPAAVALNTTTGSVTATKTASAGRYSIQYKLCDLNSPPNCATATDTLSIITASLIATPDSGTADAGIASTPILNVAANDSVDGAPATLGASGNATITKVGTWPTGIALNTTSGAVTTTKGVSAGSYPIQYKLCDLNSPPSCATTTDTVTVITASIIAVPDSGSVPAGIASTAIANVAANDTVDGAPATLGASGNATVTPVGVWHAGIALNTLTGAVTTTNGVSVGTFSVQYKLCDLNSPPDCAGATDTVTVTASILAVPDSGVATVGTAATPIANVAANDSVNGAPATLGLSGNATVAKANIWQTGIALNTTTGAVTTTAAVPVGVYSIPYKLCDKNTPQHCASTIDTVTVTASIAAVPESGIAIAGFASAIIGNVAANDLVNGASANLGASGNAAVTQFGVWPAGIALNTTTGGVTTAGTVPSGTYQFQYQLCDLNIPADCAVATDAALVTPPFTDVRISCPLFHCTPEATGVMYQSIVTPTVVTSQNSLGEVQYQGCSGDGTKLACLFTTDGVPAGNQASGLLKVLDPVTLAPLWGDAGVEGSYVLGKGVYDGAVPYLFPNGQIGAGDSSGYALYNPDGTLDLVVALNPQKGSTMGLTPLSANYAIISQTNGTLTLLDTINWVNLATLTLKDPNGASVTLVSPSTGSDGVLYAVGVNSAGTGFLFAIAMQMPQPGTYSLINRATFAYSGKTGASAVVVRPNISGLSQNLVLLHVPGLSGDSQNRLLGLLDNGASFSQSWSISLAQALTVAPSIDEISGNLYYILPKQPMIYAANIVSGAESAGPFNIQTLGAFSSSFQFNGHLVSVQTGPTGTYTLLLSGSSPARAGSPGGQFALGFQPSTYQVLWKLQILGQPEANTEAWALVPSNTPNVYCLTVAGPSSGISRLCND